MKKILLGMAAVAVLSLTVGCKGGSQATVGEADTTGFGDSLAIGFGEAQGYGIVSALKDPQAAAGMNLNKDDIKKGFKEALFADTTNRSIEIGRSMGMQLLSQIEYYERNSNVRISLNKLYDAFCEALNADSVSQQQMMEMQQKMQKLNMEMQQKMQAYKEALEMAKPEVKAAAEKGKEFIEKKMKEDPSLVKTASGLVYKVNKEGTGDKISLDKTVKINYVGKLSNDTIFDQNKGAEMNPNAVIPGFKEALQLMQKGGSYTLYIPGELAYGTQGAPGKIGPMETLIFEVEVVDVMDAPSQAAPGQAAGKPQVKVEPAKGADKSAPVKVTPAKKK